MWCPVTADPRAAQSAVATARVVNFVVPGGGLILLGLTWLGILTVLLFALSANYAVLATFILPDEVSRIWRGLGWGIAAGTYIGAQFRFAHTLRESRRAAEIAQRQQALAEARVALAEERLEDAWQALLPIHHLADQDLLIAYRIAQVLTARGDDAGAAAAWSRVRQLDQHRIYYRELSQHADAHGASSPPGGGDNPHDPNDV